MTETTAERVNVNVPNDLSEIDAPEVKAMPASPWIACDRDPTVQALFEITFPAAKPGMNTLTLCGHCSNEFGWGHASAGTWLSAHDKMKGSDH